MDTCKGSGHSCPHHLILCAFSSSVSMEGSVAETHDEMLQVLKEKMRLEGQLEALTQEASQVRGGLVNAWCAVCFLIVGGVSLIFMNNCSSAFSGVIVMSDPWIVGETWHCPGELTCQHLPLPH